MQIAFVLPSLANRGPILVVKDLVKELQKMGHVCEVFYFDDLVEVEFSVPTQKISYKSKFDFDCFDIVHSHGLRPDFFINKNKKNIRAICISTMHNIIIEEYKSTHNYLLAILVQTVWVFALKKHDAIICLTQQMRSYYERFLGKKSLFVVYNGRNIQSPTVVSDLDKNKIQDLKKRYKILGTACVVTKRKGLHQVINALPFIKDYAFVLIGDGPELKKLKAMAKQLSVEDRCLFMGSRGQAYRFYEYFDLFVMASYTEGVPLSLLEAAALKLPALCSNISVLHEIFSEKEVSFFELDNTRDFVDAVTSTMENHSEYSFNINKCYLSNYTSLSMANNYENVYRNLIKNKK